MSSILVVGSLAYDDVRTPVASRDGVLGGAASYFAVAAARYAPVRLVGVIGDDFREEDLERLRAQGADLGGLERRAGRSFRWRGTYDFALDTAETINTDLGVFADWRPSVPEPFRDSELVFLANIDPRIQLATLQQIARPKLVVLDTMNYWIEHARAALLRVIATVDVVSVNEGEARQLCETFSLVRAAREILSLGPRVLVVKRGENGAMLFTRPRGAGGGGALSTVRGAGGGQSAPTRSAGGGGGQSPPPSLFWAPGFPIEDVVDPTGAGDTFAGGFLGYLAECGSLEDAALRRAVLHGCVCASFAVEQFGVDGIASASRDAIAARYRALQELITV